MLSTLTTIGQNVVVSCFLLRRVHECQNDLKLLQHIQSISHKENVSAVVELADTLLKIIKCV